MALACSEGAPAPATSVVTPTRAVAQVIVEVDSTVLTVGSSARATVAATLDARGVPVQGGAPAWSAEPTTVLTINAQGTVTAVSAGLGKVVATVDGVQGVRDVFIRPLPVIALIDLTLRKRALLVGDTVSAAALVFDSVGTPLTGRAVDWSIDGDPTVATVSSAGLLTAVAPGEATLVAASGDVRGQLDITVTAPTPSNAVVATVAVTLPTLNLLVGDTASAQATALDSIGQIIEPRPVTWRVTSGATVASVSQAGLITAISAGSAEIEATIDGISGLGQLTVNDSVPAEEAVLPLPALPETLSFQYPTVTGRQWIVRAGGNLQGALNSAQRGDEIVIEAGAKFTGNFRLPVKSGTAADGWIIVRSDKAAQLPPQGTRVTPAQASLMPIIETPNPQPAIATAPRASGWWLSGLEVTVAPISATNYGLVTFGEGNSQRSLADVPSDLVLERSYVHATPTSKIQRCIALNSARTVIEDSYVHECHIKGFDSQAILGWNGPGPFRIVNNTLAGAGENIMFGGADPAIPNLVPGDIVVRRNYIVTPPSWKGTWTKKNIFELKNAQRVLLEGNVLDGSWSDGQTGEAIVLKVTNQNGRCTWCATRDVTIRYNMIRNAGAGFSIQGLQGGSPNPVGERLNRLLIEHNIAEGINVAPFNGSGRLLSVMQNVQNMTIRNNTLTAPGALSHFMMLADVPAATNVDFRNNIVTHGTYGLFSSKFGTGEKSLAGFRGTVTFQNIVIIGNARKDYPRATFVPSLNAAMQRSAGADQRQVQAWTQGVVVP